ncbi:UNVERIFIED_CONTAM: hypothetical protein Slati_4472000 [Sesamum latifolium]|uniref:Uncharacterized protein n=1 Tax=Sesamum latifolium TaxID=2727402 RepID=A0AAW2ST68_9LAMI
MGTSSGSTTTKEGSTVSFLGTGEGAWEESFTGESESLGEVAVDPEEEPESEELLEDIR